ncbi:putative polyol transporter 2 [Ranunculus cassubicifolius]
MDQNKKFADEAPPLDDQLKRSQTFAFACSILACMTSILLGYDIGVMSGAAIFIQRDLKINDVQLEVLVGVINLYCLIGSAAAGRTSDWIGRKMTIVLACSIFFLGSMLMGPFAFNYGMLMFGRFIAGIGMGFALMIAPVYTAELAPAAARGFLSSFPEVFINLGILLGYVSNWCFSHLSLQLGWRVMLGIAAAPSIIMGFGVLAMPESPRWLVLKGRLGDAREILIKTSPTKEEAETRLVAIKEAAGIPLDCTDDICAVPKVEKGHEVWKELFVHPTKAVRNILIAGIGIHFFQQTSGIDAVVLYSPRIFKKAGIVTENALLGCTVGVGVMKTLCILIASYFLDRVGRRPLLLGSVAGMIVSVTLLATGLTIVDQNPDKKISWAIALCLVMTLAYVGFFSLGLGPVTWVYSSEIFPLKLRAQGTSAGVAVNRVFSGVISMTFLSLSKAITIGGAFYLFACVGVIAWVFFYTCLPETRGVNLEEIEALFGDEQEKQAKKTVT